MAHVGIAGLLALACFATPPADPAIAKAMNALRRADVRAHADPTRPVYHFRPPAQWMNDPCGGIYYKGYYHLFYQLNPYGDQWDNIHWGHARSKDLIYWEHLPIAIAPAPNELRCNSGCVTINKQGVPMIFYTLVPNYDAPRDQRAAIGDDDMITWKRHPANPILTLDSHGGPRFGGGWSDCFVFSEAGRTFMVIGVDALGKNVAVPLYEAHDSGLTRWTYRGLLFSAPKSRIRNMEVPMFFKLNGKWILLFHPGGPIMYLTGSFDLQSLTFKPEKEGTLTPSKDFSSPHVFFDDKARCILFAWVRGFKSGRGWNGCLAIPRIISLGADGLLRQQPVAETKKLRSEHVSIQDLDLNNTGRIIESPRSDTLEIMAVFEPGDAKTIGLNLRRSNDGKDSVRITYDHTTLSAAGVKLPLQLNKAERLLKLHVFLDKSVMEVFVNDGQKAAVKVIYPDPNDLGVEAFATGGTARLKSLDVWKIKSIWQHK